VLDVTQDRNDTNWYATITRIPPAKPDLVIVSISAVQAANFVKQYAEARITTPLFSDYPPPPRIFEKQVGAQAGKIGLVRATFFVKSDTNTPVQKDFVAKLEARVQKELNEAHDVTYWDVVSYDAVRLVADAIKRGGIKPDGILIGAIVMALPTIFSISCRCFLQRTAIKHAVDRQAVVLASLIVG
jgi:ABC-type branched-subunit amino acid transport system substrate-binding protein